MKMFKKIFAAISLLAAMTITGCGSTNVQKDVDYDANVKEVNVQPKSLEMEIGEVYVLTYSIVYKDEQMEHKEIVEWMSSNPSVAKVDNGTITALKPGKASINLIAGYKASACVVTVNDGELPPVPPQPGEFTISLSPSSKSLDIGSSFKITATTSEEAEITWSSSNSSVASVDQTGLVNALAIGSATITASANGKSAICQVTVTEQGGSEDEKDVTVYFFIDYNNVNRNDTTKTQLLAKFEWYSDRPIGDSGQIPANPTQALDPAFPYFLGWSDHPIIDNLSDLIDVSTYVVGNRSTLYVYGIWSDVKA